MKTIQVILLLVLTLCAAPAVVAQEYYSPESADAVALPSDLFTAEELDGLLAPIALYPDPLLAQVLPASTFVEQVDAAERYVRQFGQSGVDAQPWDVSVRAVAHYPDVLFMMDQKYEWTASLGQAYLNQPQDVMDAIQRLRAEAREEGSLVSTPEQQVIVEDGYIRIVPAEPAVIYVPAYDPLAVYVEPPPPTGFITFGIGFTIGAWLNRDCDWYQHRIYYHGWRGSGWIGRARPYVSARQSVYVNTRYSVINVNRRVMQHDTVRYRNDIRREADVRRERRGAPAAPAPGTPRAAPAPAVKTPRVAPIPAAIAPHAPRPENTDFYRGREPRGTQPAARTGYGGYGSAGDAKTYRERGQSSRENMRQSSHQQQAPASGHPAHAPAAAQPALAPAPVAPRPVMPAPPRQEVPVDRGGGVRQR